MTGLGRSSDPVYLRRQQDLCIVEVDRINDVKTSMSIAFIVICRQKNTHPLTSVDTIRARVGSNGIALRLVSNCANDRPANLWIRVPPANGNWVDSKGVWMRREGNVIGIEDFGKWHAIFFCRKIMNGYYSVRTKRE